jgi:hypothetical protein
MDSQEEAKKSISPEIAGAIVESCLAAYQDWFSEVSDKSKAICGSTTKANFINDFMVHNARVLLEDHPDVKFIRQHGRSLLLIKDIIKIKLKKLNRNRRPSNIPTRAVKRYNSQLPLELPTQYTLPGVLYPITNLIAGYQANRLKTGVEAVYIVCPDGIHNKWEWRLDFEPQPTTVQVDEPIKDTPPSKPKVVVPKKGTKNKIA